MPHNFRIYVNNFLKYLDKEQLIEEVSKFVLGIVDCVDINLSSRES